MTDQTNQSELLMRARAGDAAAMDMAVRANIALVKYLVRRFHVSGQDMDDLYQLGCLGLVKAIKRFDAAYNVRFSTYAVPVILGEIRRYLRDDGPMRVSRSIRENARRIREYADMMLMERGVSPTVAEIAQALGLTGEQVLLALGALAPVRSIDESVTQDGACTLGDTIGVDDTEKTDQSLEVARLLSMLDARERAILERRYFQYRTQTEVAREFGMTQVQVSRVENRLIARLRAAAGEPGETGGTRETRVR